MHETLQRRICRVAFLALCVLPTIGLAVGVGWRLWPGRHDAVLASLGQRLGCRVSVAGISTPTPDRWRLRGVTLTDADTGAPIASIDRFEFQSVDGQVVGHGHELAIGDPAALARECANNVLRRDWPTGLRARFEQLTVGESAAWNNVTVTLSISAQDGNPAARRLDVSPRDGIASLVAERSPTATTLHLDTGGQPVRWAWLQTESAGAATFTGLLDASYTTDQNEAIISGVLSKIDPAALLGESHGVTLADGLHADVGRLRIVDGRVVELHAEVFAAHGAAEHRVLAAAAHHLGFRATPELHRRWPQSGAIAFDRLAFAVSMNADGLRIADRSDGLLVAGDQPLMLAPASGRMPLDALLHFVSPNAERFQPATRESLELANRLPLDASGNRRQQR